MRGSCRITLQMVKQQRPVHPRVILMRSHYGGDCGNTSRRAARELVIGNRGQFLRRSGMSRLWLLDQPPGFASGTHGAESKDDLRWMWIGHLSKALVRVQYALDGAERKEPSMRLSFPCVCRFAGAASLGDPAPGLAQDQTTPTDLLPNRAEESPIVQSAYRAGTSTCAEVAVHCSGSESTQFGRTLRA